MKTNDCLFLKMQTTLMFNVHILIAYNICTVALAAAMMPADRGCLIWGWRFYRSTRKRKVKLWKESQLSALEHALLLL
jgi:predicted membrane protein